MLPEISFMDKPMPTPEPELLVTAPTMPKLHKANSALTLSVSVTVTCASRLMDAMAVSLSLL